MLPGPSSSQLGFLIGMRRAGWAGALAAFAGFTLPSALLMIAAAWGLPHAGFAGAGGSSGAEFAAAALHGLEVTALCVAGHAAFGMLRSFANDAPRIAIVVLAAAAALVVHATWTQLAVIAMAALAGAALGRKPPGAAANPARAGPAAGPDADVVEDAADADAAARLSRTARCCLALHAALLGAALALHARGTWHGLAGIYRAGSLVFGGGHVVLPLLQTAVVAGGDVDAHAFLEAYGLAQAMPGPMFSLAAYLGWHLRGPVAPLGSAVLALLAIFLPGLLLAAGMHPWWARLQASVAAASSLSAINAAVTGLLLAALATPIGATALRAAPDFAIAAAGFAILLDRRRSASWVVLWCVAASVLVQRFL